MSVFLATLAEHNLKYERLLRKDKVTVLQVNMGNLCNQKCRHCHIDASPQGKNIMPKKVIDDILTFISKYKIITLDLTGGAPELNPHFEYFVAKARDLVSELIVRSNLTVFFEEGKAQLPEFFKKNRVHLICSLPCYREENVDYQRGKGVFKKSIKALKILNKLGFSCEDLDMDLVYNPKGTALPPSQESLEKEYKEKLYINYGIRFNHLLTLTNVPIKRFKDYLVSKGDYEHYFHLLRENFNPQVLDNLMCRTLLSVGYDGRLYDCDFNQALGLCLSDEEGVSLTIGTLNPHMLKGRKIASGEHCLSCTAGSGSSCQGALEGIQAARRGLQAKYKKLETRYRADYQSTLPQNVIASCKKNGDSGDKHFQIKEYYGKVLKNRSDLKTSACCTTDSLPAQLKKITLNIHREIKEKFYGCGSPLPPLLKGQKIIDLGCGTGRDVYIASYLAGEEGYVTGVDMTKEQIALAERYLPYQMRKFGFLKPNVEFRKGYIEDLKEISIEDNSQDVVISNCVINLSPDKKRVFSEIFRVLKEGGELYFSDIFTGQRVPEHLKNDPVLYGECMAGALYIEDFSRLLREVGCLDYRVVSKKKIILQDEEIEKMAGGIDFYSLTVRAFKLNNLEDICEDYGQVAIYLGTIPQCPHRFILDEHHIFITKKPMLVCGNTAEMLAKSRHGKHFKIIGNRNVHYGPFNCSPASLKIENQDSFRGSCC